MARFFLPRNNIQDNRGTIGGAELEHLRKVLRLRPGDRIALFDDVGWEHEGVVRSYGAHHGEIEILRSYLGERESPLEVTLAVGLTKGDKIDFVVEKATELGVRAVVPFVSSRTVPRLDGKKIEKRQERWRKIALSAVKQCGRARMPEIPPLSDFRDLVCKSWSCPLKLIFWERESAWGLREFQKIHTEPRPLIVMVGPEGGFSVEEAGEAREHGFQAVRLGSRILRAETAAVAALSLVQFLWGDLG